MKETLKTGFEKGKASMCIKTVVFMKGTGTKGSGQAGE